MIKVFHCHPRSPNQREISKAFEAGGFDITTDLHTPADIHVISGPNFAYEAYIGKPNVLMVNRAFWGDGDKNKKVSIGWLQANGTRKFATGEAPRPKPKMQPWKTRENSCIVLPDYSANMKMNGKSIDAVRRDAAARFGKATVRLHPAGYKGERPTLMDDISKHDVAIGGLGTSVFEAIILGVPVICDPLNACAAVAATDMSAPLVRPDRTQWLHDLSYAQFSLAEIANGTAWNLLKDAR